MYVCMYSGLHKAVQSAVRNHASFRGQQAILKPKPNCCLVIVKDKKKREKGKNGDKNISQRNFLNFIIRFFFLN